MLSILAMLSDLPYYIAEIITKLTGADMSAFVNMFSDFYSEIMEAVNAIIK